jgi:hypothetical protein
MHKDATVKCWAIILAATNSSDRNDQGKQNIAEGGTSTCEDHSQRV